MHSKVSTAKMSKRSYQSVWNIFEVIIIIEKIIRDIVVPVYELVIHITGAYGWALYKLLFIRFYHY